MRCRRSSAEVTSVGTGITSPPAFRSDAASSSRRSADRAATASRTPARTSCSAVARPFEVWAWLGDLHFEPVYMLVTLAVWVVYPNKRWLPNVQHAAYAGFAAAVLACWVMSPWADQASPVVENWFKVLVFYVLLV